MTNDQYNILLGEKDFPPEKRTIYPISIYGGGEIYYDTVDREILLLSGSGNDNAVQYIPSEDFVPDQYEDFIIRYQSL